MQAFALTGVNTRYGFIQMYKFVQCTCTCAFDCEIKWPSLGKSVKRLNACASLRRPATSRSLA